MVEHYECNFAIFSSLLLRLITFLLTSGGLFIFIFGCDFFPSRQRLIPISPQVSMEGASVLVVDSEMSGSIPGQPAIFAISLRIENQTTEDLQLTPSKWRLRVGGKAYKLGQQWLQLQNPALYSNPLKTQVVPHGRFVRGSVAFPTTSHLPQNIDDVTLDAPVFGATSKRIYPLQVILRIPERPHKAT